MICFVVCQCHPHRQALRRPWVSAKKIGQTDLFGTDLSAWLASFLPWSPRRGYEVSSIAFIKLSCLAVRWHVMPSILFLSSAGECQSEIWSSSIQLLPETQFLSIFNEYSVTVPVRMFAKYRDNGRCSLPFLSVLGARNILAYRWRCSTRC